MFSDWCGLEPELRTFTGSVCSLTEQRCFIWLEIPEEKLEAVTKESLSVYEATF